MKKYAGILAFLLMALLAAWLETDERDGDRNVSQRETRSQEKPDNTAPRANAGKPVAQGTGFDFYVLSLSWSPTYCESAKGQDNDSQCGTNRSFGFVMHGLWPQNERGYPEFCASREPQRVPDAIGRPMMGIMPSMGLIGHQWRKHGSCSGLSQKDYFEVARQAYNQVKLPAINDLGESRANISTADVETAFMKLNPDLKPDAIAATCAGKKLEEVRICMTKDLRFRSCAEVNRQGCRLPAVEIPPVR